MDNLRGSLFMILAMAGFAIEDMLIKQMAGALPTGQIIALIGAGGAVLCVVWTRFTLNEPILRGFANPRILARNACEAFGTLGFVTALALVPLTVASAILQATPLFVTLGAALFLGQAVGWRRWAAVFVGFLGVLLVLRPGMADFNANALFALMGVIGLGARDLITRAMPPAIPSSKLALFAFITLIPTGILLMLLLGQSPAAITGPDIYRMILAVFLGIAAYAAIIAATRLGDVAFVSPFRYSRMAFALLIGVVVFAERPDALTLLGTFIIIASGLFALWREQRRRVSSISNQTGL